MGWKDVLRNVAPTLATTLTGGNPLAGTAVKFISEKLLGKPDASEDELEAAIVGATPDQLAKLKQIDNDFKVEMEQLGIDLEKVHQEDRGDARDMAKANMMPQIILSAAFILGYFSVCFLLFTSSAITEMDDFAKGQIGIMLGILTAAIPQILNFWFGSSSGSKEKTRKLKGKN